MDIRDVSMLESFKESYQKSTLKLLIHFSAMQNRYKDRLITKKNMMHTAKAVSKSMISILSTIELTIQTLFQFTKQSSFFIVE